MTINSLSEKIWNKQEIKTIASYRFFIQDFLKLIKDKGASEKETILLKILLTLSEAMLYEKQPNNSAIFSIQKFSKKYIFQEKNIFSLSKIEFKKKLMINKEYNERLNLEPVIRLVPELSDSK